jgi:hypothetical protein
MKISISGMTAAFSMAILPSFYPTTVCFAQEKLSPFATFQIAQKKSKADFQLATARSAAPIYLDSNDFPVVRIAAEAFAGDIQSVTGAKPAVLGTAPATGQSAIFVGTLGKSRLIDEMVAKKKIDVSKIRGQWETFAVATVENPVPGVSQGLVIVGSDRRGTAFGLFSLSESIGVSPWVWWADVKPTRRDSLVISRTTFTSKVPSVKYRGIFINDEDWGLQPWAAKTFEPETKDIGPKTYAKVCELLLRLKSNYLWPAMHPSTKAFNFYPQDKIVADQYAIVMGSSHAEPMLRNNVDEWDHKTRGDFNYVTNRDSILNYWEERVKENGKYENSYTIGMRGIHDSSMEGGGTPAQQVARLEDIFARQRAMLARHVNPDPSQVPQVFVPYKEVLPIYQNGLKVPDDVTLVWVDDNHGYIRQLSNATERKRKGGAGVYYHFSYWGAPEDFLWLGSTSPALTAYEMKKAYAYGADQVWVFNVGDIKPIEKEMEFGLRLAYDVDRYSVDKALDFLNDWATESFGPAHSQGIAAVLREYYRLASQAKPEHINRVTFTKMERAQRLLDYAAISRQADAIYAQLPADKKDAYYQLVLYPVKCADLMNQKQTYTTQGNAELAVKAYDEIQRLTAYYNQEMAGGKWNNMMDAKPRNGGVFQRPDARKIALAAQQPAPIFQLPASEARVSGAMKLVGKSLVAAAPERQMENSGHTATFTINSPQAQKVALYFLAQCNDDNHDSWFVSLNNQKVVSNDHVTGTAFRWLKIMDADLKEGSNELVVSQREAGTVIQQIALMKPDTAPVLAEVTPDFIIDAGDSLSIKNTPSSQWRKIEGLGTDKNAMTLLPFLTPPIADADLAKAPSITYALKGTFPGCTVETRFVPTHQVTGGPTLRYAISVDGGPAQIRNINAPEFSGVWSSNVLNGYAADSTLHLLKTGATHTITISLLDPGMVLSQLRVFTDKPTNSPPKPTVTPIANAIMNSKAPVATLPAKDDFQIYLLMGQSNMVGRDTRFNALPVSDPRVLALDSEDHWVVAKDPIHTDKNIAPGVGPGLSFALEMLKTDPKITVGLVPCAVGGTPLQRWTKGADLYEKAISRAKAASQSGVLKGVLWHQGESDSDVKGKADTYEPRLIQMFKDLRNDLNQPNLPIVVAQLGDFVSRAKYPYIETVRAAIEHVPTAVPQSGYASSAGLIDKGDALHFSADAEKEFGIRYAKAMRDLQKN